MQESNQEFLTWEAADGRVALLKVGERSKHDVFFLTVVSFPNAGNAWDILILIDLRNFLDTNPCIYIYKYGILEYLLFTIVFWTISYNMT